MSDAKVLQKALGILAVIFSAVGFFPVGIFAVWNFCLTEFSPYRIFALQDFSRTRLLSYGVFALRRKTHTAKISYCENSVWWKFRTAKNPTTKISTAKIPATITEVAGWQKTDRDGATLSPTSTFKPHHVSKLRQKKKLNKVCFSHTSHVSSTTSRVSTPVSVQITYLGLLVRFAPATYRVCLFY